MNNRKVISLGFALAVSALPLQAHAIPSKYGLDACVKAMVEDLSETNGVPIEFQTDPDSKAGRSRLGRREVFHLDARDSKTNEVVARVDCVVNERAEVRELITMPLAAEDASVRSYMSY